MAGENYDSEIPPGFAIPLAKGETTPTIPHHQTEKCTRKQHIAISAEASSMTMKETLAVPVSPVLSPLGSSINVPLLIIDEEHRDTKTNLNPLSILSPPPNPCLRINKFSASHINEESKTIISHVKSVLVFQLTSGSTKNVEAMVKCANNAFFTLDFLEEDYTSFYKDVRDFIAYHYDLLSTKRQREMQSFPADQLKTRYEDAIICTNDLKDEIFQTQGRIMMVVKKKETLERQIGEAMELIGKLKQCVSVLKQEEEVLKNEKQKRVAAYEIAHREVLKVCSQVEADKNVLREIDQRKNAALNGIESATKRLKSVQY